MWAVKEKACVLPIKQFHAADVYDLHETACSLQQEKMRSDRKVEWVVCHADGLLVHIVFISEDM